MLLFSSDEIKRAGSQWPVAYVSWFLIPDASGALSDTEQPYAKIAKEALAVTLASERF